MKNIRMAKRAETFRKPSLQASGQDVDWTLIRWMARLTPTQRLAVLHDHIRLVAALRRAAPTD